MNDLAALWESAPDEFERLRERGRRSVFHQKDIIPAWRDVVVQYEDDARKAAAAGAYSAAITQLGAGLEGLLLLRCLRSKSKAQRLAASLPKRVRPTNPSDPTTWMFESLIETCFAAGWLPLVSTETAQYSPAGLAHLLRAMRNYVHPGRYARERPWSEVEERDFLDADAIYRTLMVVTLKPLRKQ